MLDGNNTLFPIEFVVVETNNLLSWHWFITNLKDTFARALDQEKELKDAIEHLLLYAENRACIRHP